MFATIVLFCPHPKFAGQKMEEQSTSGRETLCSWVFKLEQLGFAAGRRRNVAPGKTGSAVAQCPAARITIMAPRVQPFLNWRVSTPAVSLSSEPSTSDLDGAGTGDPLATDDRQLHEAIRDLSLEKRVLINVMIHPNSAISTRKWCRKEVPDRDQYQWKVTHGGKRIRELLEQAFTRKNSTSC